MSGVTGGWQDINPVRITVQRDPEWLALREIVVDLDRVPDAKWCVLFEQVVKNQPDGLAERDHFRVLTSFDVPCLWINSDAESAGSWEAEVPNLIAVANLRYRTQ